MTRYWPTTLELTTDWTSQTFPSEYNTGCTVLGSRPSADMVARGILKVIRTEEMSLSSPGVGANWNRRTGVPSRGGTPCGSWDSWYTVTWKLEMGAPVVKFS
jgi:hypothetical protein